MQVTARGNPQDRMFVEDFTTDAEFLQHMRQLQAISINFHGTSAVGERLLTLFLSRNMQHTATRRFF
jgi:hypothetical protein